MLIKHGLPNIQLPPNHKGGQEWQVKYNQDQNDSKNLEEILFFFSHLLGFPWDYPIVINWFFRCSVVLYNRIHFHLPFGKFLDNPKLLGKGIQ